MRKMQFANENYYHICNRGTTGMTTYKDIKDYLHFLACLKEFNTTRHVEFRILHILKKLKSDNETKSPEIQSDTQPVEIVAYCLMPNHFHIIVKQILDNGISLFMQKLGTGYTMYFNSRHKNFGHIFQGKFQAQEIHTSEQLLYTSAYVHLNPLKRKEEMLMYIKIDPDQYKKVLHYPWSTLAEYAVKTSELYFNMPELKHVRPRIHNNAIKEFLGAQSYEDYIISGWGKQKPYVIDKKLY